MLVGWAGGGMGGWVSSGEGVYGAKLFGKLDSGEGISILRGRMRAGGLGAFSVSPFLFLVLSQ